MYQGIQYKTHNYNNADTAIYKNVFVIKISENIKTVLLFMFLLTLNYCNTKYNVHHVMTWCNVVVAYLHFSETHCLYIQDVRNFYNSFLGYINSTNNMLNML